MANIPGPFVPCYVGLALKVEEKKSLVLLLVTIDAGDEVRPERERSRCKKKE